MSKKYDPDTKAAVMAALLEGQAAAYIAREYSIPVGTVKRNHTGASEIMNGFNEEVADVLEIHGRIGRLFEIVGGLSETIDTLTDRLEPVLYPTKAEKSLDVAEDQIASPVARKLSELGAMVDRESDRILDLMKQLEI